MRKYVKTQGKPPQNSRCKPEKLALSGSLDAEKASKKACSTQYALIKGTPGPESFKVLEHDGTLSFPRRLLLGHLCLETSTDTDPNTGKSRRSPIFRRSSEFRYSSCCW